MKHILYSLILSIIVFKHSRAVAQEYGAFYDINVDAYSNYFESSEFYRFSSFGYYSRGLPFVYNSVLLNSVPLNSLGDGRVPYYALGFPYRISQQHSEIGVGLRRNIITDFSNEDSGYAAVGVSSRTYSYRVEGGYNFGILEDDGVAVRLSVGKRWGRSLTTDGVFTDNYNFAFSAAAKVGKGTIDVIALLNPVERGVARATTLEAYDLASDMLYNPAWGVQGNEQRSVNVRKSLEPIISTNYTVALSERYSLSSSISTRFGRNSYSALSWQNTPNPLPDYYAYMPSFQESEAAADAITSLWKNNINVRQIDFQSLYNINNEDSRAHYIIEDRVSKPLHIMAQSTLAAENFNITIKGAVESELNFKEISSLLGGDYWLDIDSFVEQDGDVKEKTQNNLQEPNRKVGEGERFGYNYRMNNCLFGIEGNYLYSIGKLNFEANGGVSIISSQRVGYYEKENFAGGGSLGASQGVVNFDASAIGRVRYSVNPNFKLHSSLMFRSIAPNNDVIFLNPEYRNALNEKAQNSMLFGADFNMEYNSDNFRGSTSLYYYGERNGCSLKNLYDDMLSEYVNYSTNNISTSRTGLEGSVEVRLINDLWAKGAVALQSNLYSGNPVGSAYKESTGELLVNDEILYFDGLHIGGVGEKFGAISLAYNPYGWSVEISGIWLGGLYDAVSPLRYTSRVLEWADSGFVAGEQNSYGVNFSLDVSGGYTFKFRGGESMTLFAGISNILNNNDIVRYGSQNDRFYRRDNTLTPQGSRIYHALGINFSSSITLRF